MCGDPGHRCNTCEHYAAVVDENSGVGVGEERWNRGDKMDVGKGYTLLTKILRKELS